jgi:S1-C subfamily serine protease
MRSERTAQKLSPLSRFFTITSLIFFVIALALDELIVYAEPAIGPVSFHEKSLPVSAAEAKAPLSVVTIPTRSVPATPTQVHLGSRSSVIIDESGDILTNNHKAAP